MNGPPTTTKDCPEVPPDTGKNTMAMVAAAVIKRVGTNLKNTPKLCEDDAIALGWVFGQNVVKSAFGLISMKDGVVIFKSPQNSYVFRVQGSTDYKWIVPGYAVCACPAWIRAKMSICKHVLAAHLYANMHDLKTVCKDMCHAELVGHVKEVIPH